MKKRMKFTDSPTAALRKKSKDEEARTLVFSAPAGNYVTTTSDGVFQVWRMKTPTVEQTTENTAAKTGDAIRAIGDAARKMWNRQ